MSLPLRARNFAVGSPHYYNHIAPEDIGTVIGPGGKMIRKIIEETGAQSTSRTTVRSRLLRLLPEAVKLPGHDYQTAQAHNSRRNLLRSVTRIIL